MSLLAFDAVVLARGGRVTRDGRVALLAEGHALDPERRLADASAFWAGLDGGAADVAAVGLGRLGDVPVRLLSTGQRRRAGMARVVASGAAVWLLDEPANGLDADGVAMLEGLIAAHRSGGGVVVVATHQPIAVPGALSVALGESGSHSVRPELVEGRPALVMEERPSTSSGRTEESASTSDRTGRC